MKSAPTRYRRVSLPKPHCPGAPRVTEQRSESGVLRVADAKTFEKVAALVHSGIDTFNYETVVIRCEIFSGFITTIESYPVCR